MSRSTVGLRLFYTFVVMASMACAARVVPASPGVPTEPRASWMIRAGDHGSEREVCRSDSNTTCVLPASSAGKPVSVMVSVYLFPAEGPTTFQGAFMSGFIPGPGQHGYEAKVDYKAVPGKHATAMSVNGIVTDRPGEYPFRIALLADVPGHPDPRQFQQTFNVRVVPS